MSNFYIKSLDGLRGIAVLLVIVYHFSKLPFISFDFEIGWVGVQLFFVLSGYLITRILLKEKNLQLGFYLKRFYWRRLLRIFPIYFLYLFLIAAIHFVTNEPSDFNFAAPFLFTYTYNYSVLFKGWEITRLYSHLWSLSVEEQFYIVWPLIVFVFSNKSVRRFCFSLVLIVPLVRLILKIWFAHLLPSEELIGTAIYWFSLSHFDAFAIGGLLNLLNEKEKITILKKRFIIWAIVLIAGLINLIYYSMPLTGYEITSFGYLLPSLENYQYVWSYTLLNLLFASIILKNEVYGSRLMSNKILVFIGKISYGMYLYHFIIIVFMEKVFKGPIVNDFITLLACVIIIVSVSYFSYKLYEEKFLELKYRKFALEKNK